MPWASARISVWSWHAVACSLYALGFGAYFRLVLEAFGVPALHLGFMTLEKSVALIACVLFSYINLRGASETGKAGNVVTVGKIVIIAAFIAAGLWAMAHHSGWQLSFEPLMTNGWAGVFGAMGLTFIAFEGYEIIAQTSEEVENPKRNVPRATFLSLLIVVPIYLLVALVAVGAVTPPAGLTSTQYLGQEKEIALVRAADQFVVGGGIAILVGGLLSTLSALNATIYSSSRVAFAMARDANLPTFLSRVHETRATPHVAILASALIIIGMAVLLPIEEVAAAADIMFLLLFVQVNLALISLRKKRPDLDRGFRVPFMPLVPILAIGTMLFLAVFLFTHYPMAWVAAGGWIAVGASVYYGYSRKSETVYQARTEWMERIARKEYSVLVALSNPKTLPSLMETGLAIARHHGGELVAMSAIEVPEGQTLMSGRRQARELEALLESAVEYAEAGGCDAHSVVKIARRTSHAIVETALEEDCNFLIIGRPVPHTFLERLVESTVDRVLRDAPCQIGVVYGDVRPDKIREVVVPVTNTRNSRLAIELAPAFGERYSVPTRTVTAIGSQVSSREAERLETEAREILTPLGLDGTLKVLRQTDTAGALAREAKRGSLVVIGAPSAGSLVALLGETIPSVIAERRKSPVIVVREVAEQRIRRLERVLFGRT